MKGDGERAVRRVSKERLTERRAFLAGQMAFMACQWLAISALTWRGSPAAVGDYFLVNAIVQPIVWFAGMHVRPGYVTENSRESAFADFNAIRTRGAILGTLFSAGVLVSINRTGAERLLLAGAVLVGRAIEIYANLEYGLLQAGGRMDLIGRSLFLRGVIGVVTAFVAMALWADVGLAVALTSVSWLAVYVLHDRRVADQPRNVQRAPAIGQLVRRLMPLALSILVVSIGSSVPRLAVASSWGSTELGKTGPALMMYAAFVYFAESVVDSSLRVTFQRAEAEGSRVVVRPAVQMFALSVPVGALASWTLTRPFGWVLQEIFGNEYRLVSSALWLLILAGLVQAAVVRLRNAALAVGRRWSRMSSDLLGVVAVVVGSVAFVPRSHANGFAYALLMGALIQGVWLAYVLISGNSKRDSREVHEWRL